MNAIYKFVLGLIGKRSGVVTALPNQKQIEFQANIIAEKFMRNGIDPNGLKSPEQVKNVLANIDQANMRVIPADSPEGARITRGLGIGKKADVMDMKGNKIPEGSKIMGGKEIKESDAAIKARIEADNKKSLESIKEKQYEDAVKKEQAKADADPDYIMDIIDPEDFAIGGRVGLKGGTAEKFLKFLKSFKIKQSGDDVKDFLSKRKFMKDILGNTEKNKRARELAEIKKAMTDVEGYKFPEVSKENIEKQIGPILLKDRKLNSDGGRIGLNKGGGLLKLINLFSKKSPYQAGKDYLKSVKDKTLRANETGKFMDLPLAEVGIPATSGAFITNQMKKKLQAMNEVQKEEQLKDFIIELEKDEFYQKYPELKDETIANYTEKLFGEKKADGGRIGYKVGSVDKIRRLILKAMGAGTAGVIGAKSGIFSLGKGATKQAAKEVVQQSTTTPPPYFFKLAEKIKKLGDDATSTTDRTISKTLKSKDGKSTYLLEEDVSTGDTIIKKVNKEGDEMITDIQIMELKKGEVVMGKNGKPVKTPDEYEEVTEANARIEGDTFNDPYYSDGIEVDDIIKEVDDTTPSIKYASGGLAYMLGE